jgi:hypothetical protein
MGNALAVAFIVGWIVFVGMLWRSVWLISWKYAVATVIVLAVCFGLIIIAYHDSASGVGVLIYAYLFMAYVIYYKYMMREKFLKPIRSWLLIEKNRNQKLQLAWLFIYMPHTLFFVMIIWIILISVFPELKSI